LFLTPVLPDRKENCMPGTNGSVVDPADVAAVIAPAPKSKKSHPSQQQLELLDKLQVPFDPLIVQWRIVEKCKAFGKLKGRVIPYADKVAYQERLNRLVTAVGWTQSLVMHTSQPVQHDEGHRPSAKIIAVCQLTIHSLGSHSSSGEEWTTDENAATTAEAQAFKRACASFGLGSYLYYFFRGLWVDLDENERPDNLPPLPKWATPDGWLQGARPQIERLSELSSDLDLIRQIETMHGSLGQKVYRGMLKELARVWDPKDIASPEHARSVLDAMKTAEDLLTRGRRTTDILGKDHTAEVLGRFNLKSIAEFADLGTLERVVLALESKLSALEEAS
jgi:hypothetical protein